MRTRNPALVSILANNVYPSGDFSVGRVPRERKRAEDERYDKTCAQLHVWENSQWEQKGVGIKTQVGWEILPLAPRLVPSLKFSQRPNERGRYGLKGITSKGKRIVRSAATLKEMKWGRSNTGFATITLPALDPCDMWYIATQWHEVSRKFYQEVSRELQRRGADGEIVGVTEIQEERWKRDGVPALHLHFVYHARKRRDAPWHLSANWCRAVWRRILENTLGHPIDYPSSAVDLQVVKRSASRYLGKYMSKGVKVCEEFIEAGMGECLPRQWWHCSKRLAAAVKSACIRDSGEIAYFLWDYGEALVEAGYAYWCKAIECMDKHGKKWLVGYAGCLNERGMELIEELRSRKEVA